MSSPPHSTVDKFSVLTPARVTRVLPACDYALSIGNERFPCSIIAYTHGCLCGVYVCMVITYSKGKDQPRGY